ncbi:putative AC transposase [Purpureocillium lavendulum]|uniref:AC transposase n=1 Tax=Purpureocillium lavendulum TaxID=1247861 RepID=A0AB34FR39_9HYPO|nr:putative AC transposase [Purpureocillium lavendulum]
MGSLCSKQQTDDEHELATRPGRNANGANAAPRTTRRHGIGTNRGRKHKANRQTLPSIRVVSVSVASTTVRQDGAAPLGDEGNRDENQTAPPPVRVVSMAEVAARTALLLEQRAAQAATGSPASPGSPSSGLESGPAKPQNGDIATSETSQLPGKKTVRLSTLHAEVISSALKTGDTEITQVTDLFDSVDMIIEDPMGFTARSRSRSSWVTARQDGVAVPQARSNPGEYATPPSSAPPEPFRPYDTNPKVFRGHERSVRAVVFSADGKRLVSGSDDRNICLWDLSTGQAQKMTNFHIGSVCTLAVSSDGNFLVSGSSDGEVRRWELHDSLLLVETLSVPTRISSWTISKDSRYLVMAGEDHRIRVWDMGSAEIRRRRSWRAERVSSVAVSPDNRYMASGFLDGTLRVWTLSGTLVEALSDHADSVNGVAFSPCSSCLASCSSDQTVILWHVSPEAQVKKLHTLHEHQWGVFCVAFNYKGDRVASGSLDDTIIVWQVETGHQLQVIRGHTSTITCLSFSPRSNQIASGSSDKTVRIWDVEEDTCEANQNSNEQRGPLNVPETGAV